MPEAENYDSAWKEALEAYFSGLMQLCSPVEAELIDWSKGFEFLDKELEPVVQEAAAGPQRVDKLARVHRIDGAEEWVLVHVEVQSQAVTNLPGRMYRYHHRIEERYGHEVLGVAILADERPDWRPTVYEWSLGRCRVRFEFPVSKLLDFQPHLEELQRSTNPAALVIAAHLRNLETKGADEARFRWKWKLTRSLYERGYSKEEVQRLFRLIDWFLRLPNGLAKELTRQITELEQEHNMPYITSVEQIGLERGLTRARQEDILSTLEVRFGKPSELTAEKVKAIHDAARLRELLRLAVTLESCAEFEAHL